ncbi:MFS transporter [Candidatus Bathyarchaeota archaeon]|nr:MFS transporter [Candidatus Bathyarchaeota archaeon]
MPNDTRGLTVFNRDLKLILTCNVIGSFGDGLYSYLLPVYMRETLGADPVQIGILYAVTNLFAALTLLLAGKLADRYDRKKIMIAGWLAWLPAPLIFSFARDWLQMLPGMAMWGFWLGSPTTTAYVITAADKQKLTLTFTTISAGWSMGYIFSPAVGGYLSGTMGMQFVFYLAFIFYALASLTLFFIRSRRASQSTQQTSEERTSFFKLLRTGKLLRLSVFFASIMFVLMMFRPFVAQFLADVYRYGDFEIGIFGSVAFLSSAVLGVLLGRLGDRSRKSYALALSMILCSLSLVPLLLFANFYILIAAFFIAGGSYVTWSLMSAIVGPLAPESCRARWVSIPQTVSMFSSIVAPYVGGFLYDVSPYYPFMVGIVAALVFALLASTRLLDEK